MLNFALEASNIAHQLRTLEDIAIKVACADSCAIAQNTVAKASNDLYNVIVKEALSGNPTEIRHMPVVKYVNKLATVLGKQPASNDLQVKIAAAIVVDDALNTLVSQTTNDAKIAELREAQLFGREYFVELLRNVL